MNDSIKNVEEKHYTLDSQSDNLYKNNYDDTIDIIKLYFDEICKYPLLSQEEELVLGQNLKKADKSKIAIPKYIIGSGKILEINLPMVFSLCKNNKLYNEIIQLLLSCYKNNSSNKIIYEKIKQYYEISKKIKRPLNDIELKKYFNIDKIDYEEINDEELLNEVDNYICYKKSFDTMVNSNLRLVVSVAKKLCKDNLEIMDLISVGNIGLMKAVSSFDSSLGYKFSTYGIWQIKRSIQLYILSETNKIRIPENLNNNIIKLKRKISLLEQSYQKKLSIKEISEILDIPINKLCKCLNYEIEFISLNQKVNDEEINLEEYISSDEDILKIVLNKTLKEDIKDLFKNLTEQELDVIKMHYGFDEYEENRYSLCEIGTKYNVTHQRISQIENRSFKKMKQLIKKNKKCSSLKDYLEE